LQPVTITLNGREVSGLAGTTILELATESGVDIPTLCHDVNLAPVGACRVCLVEEERSGGLLASCVTPIASGMVINTHSERVVEHRKTIVKLMLASHPDSCVVCDKGNRCQLRQLASDMGIGLLGFERLLPVSVSEELNPFLERDLSKCILCAKCIRACQELVVEGAIDYYQRGFAARPATVGDVPLEYSECTFCGTCVALCPTGALMEKETAYRGTSHTSVETTCPWCGCGCSLDVEAKDGRIVRVRPGGNGSENKGALCVRGSYGYDFVHSPDRLTTPLVREEGALREASWDEALEVVAGGLARLKSEHGGDSLAVLGSPKCTNEENYLLQRFSRTVLGTNNIDNGSRLYNAASREGLGASLGFSGTTNRLSHLEHAGAILVVGADPDVCAPVVSYAIKRAVKQKGARLIVIDPRRTKLSSFADVWLRPRVGTDVVLMNALCKVVIDQGLFDDEFVSRRTDNFDALAEELRECDLAFVESATGVGYEGILQAARLYSAVSQAAIVYGTGVTQYPNGPAAVRALANLVLLTGNVGRSGGGVYALQMDANGQGACDVGALPDFLPGYRSVSDAEGRERLEGLWESPLPREAGLTAVELLGGPSAGRVKGLYVVGDNVMLGFPNGRRVAELLASLDLLVVQDIFLTETARMATVVLPGASFAEKDGTYTSFDGSVRKLQVAVPAPGASLPDGEIVMRLAEKMGTPMRYSSPAAVMDEIVEVCSLPGYRAYVDGSYAQADSGSKRQDELGNGWGVGRIYGGLFPEGFARFCPSAYVPVGDSPGDYPFTLVTGPTLFRFGTGARGSRSSRLERFCPAGFVEMCLRDAESLEVKASQRVRIASPVGVVECGVRVTETLPQGTVFVPCSFPDIPVNQLFDVAVDGEGMNASCRSCSVRIERIECRE